jgi:hypothetical protein
MYIKPLDAPDLVENSKKISKADLGWVRSEEHNQNQITTEEPK